MSMWINQFCGIESAKKLWQVAGRRLAASRPAFIACCGCLQFDQACNSQYLGVA